MPYDLSGVLVLGISSRALFDAEDEHRIFQNFGKKAYVEHQIAHEDVPMRKGTGFFLVKAILNLNSQAGKKISEVIVISQNEPEAGLRVMNSIESYELDISRAAFTGGESVSKYLNSFNVVLFLSKSEDDVKSALMEGVPSALLYDPPSRSSEDATEIKELRIAFDGDAVIFSDESERIYQEKGITAFFEHEKENSVKELPEGPFAPFLRALSKIQNEASADNGGVDVNIALVTARNSPAHKRVILTFRAWGIKINEMFFLGGVSKDNILKAYNPHIFFDDQDIHAGPASEHVPTGKVPSGVANDNEKQSLKDDPSQMKLDMS